MEKCVVSLSGGMDSSTLLIHCIEQFGAENVTAVSFNYGQKHKVELERAKSLVKYLKSVKYKVVHKVINMSNLADVLSSALTDKNWEVPEGHYEQDNMKETVVPNRNKIFSSIVQGIALSIANRDQCNVYIALGIHAGDHAVYPDCRTEFRDADEAAFKVGNWNAERVNYYIPYIMTDKYGILQDGRSICDRIGIDFNSVYSRTNTSYKPIWLKGTWYSDYKSASSIERIEAFIKLGIPDPVEYADESGLQTWEFVKAYAQNILDNFKN